MLSTNCRSIYRRLFQGKNIFSTDVFQSPTSFTVNHIILKTNEDQQGVDVKFDLVMLRK